MLSMFLPPKWRLRLFVISTIGTALGLVSNAKFLDKITKFDTNATQDTALKSASSQILQSYIPNQAANNELSNDGQNPQNTSPEDAIQIQNNISDMLNASITDNALMKNAPADNKQGQK